MKSKRQPRVCIINFADGKFIPAQERLRQTLKDVGYNGGIHFANTIPVGCPPHIESPWGFKPFLMEEARQQGYDILIWVDSAIMAHKPLTSLINRIVKKGVFGFSRKISSMGAWTSDFALSKTGIARADAYKIPDVISIVVGIDIRNPKGKIFLNEWKRIAEDKDILLGIEPPLTLSDTFWNEKGQLSQDPRVKGHRHDQPVLSYLHHVLSIEPCGDLVFDIMSEAQPGLMYSKYIPFDTVLVENRDFRMQFTDPLKNLQAYSTTPASILYSLLRKCKDIVRAFLLLIVKKPELAVTLMSPRRMWYSLTQKPRFEDVKTRPI